ncbi:UDP-N-acetylmuramate--L-alanine ligase [bacterium]|nr:UDP-N-acetylmuramate--L-alanine ligase [Actinomycetota bacterium]MBE32544.1 UDP-N-acetylmuramate--L-alanine ligase [bacterium]|tara:strand:- start:13113 stop:14510 length:1398 start_codon:yes stop_codon:yes gene_type:complete
MKSLTLINKNIHFIGIAGSGMIALAQYLRAWGRCKVTGSEIRETSAAKDLLLQGINISFSHHEDNVKEADIVVYSSAISDSNCELRYAQKHKVACFSRGEFLAELMALYQRQVVIAGTHGKTTTTGMLIHISDAAGVTPSFMIGGELPPYHINGRYSESSTFIAESDESDGSFLLLKPSHIILNNLEAEHLHYYKSPDNLFQAFNTFFHQSLEHKSKIVINYDSPQLVSIAKSLDHKNFVSFSIDHLDSDFTARNIAFNQNSSSFDLYQENVFKGTIHLNLIGRHNIYNALAACSLALTMGLSISYVKKGLESFQGVKRRIQHICTHNNIQVYDDYGHHPTEIEATLDGLKQSKQSPITCVFQPHRYSRVKEHMEDFHNAFNHADRVFITPIYSANEVNKDDSLMESMITGIQKHSNCEVSYFNSFDDIIGHLISTVKSGDIVITMGAGDIYKVSNELATHYQNL